MKDSLTYKQIVLKTGNTVHNDLQEIQKSLSEYVHNSAADGSSVKADTIFTVLVTISIFAIGIIIDRWLKNCDKKDLEKSKREYLLFHLRRANEEFLLRLKGLYEEYSKRDFLDDGMTSTPPRIISSDFQRLLKTNYEDLFMAFSDKEALSKSQSQIEFVDEVLREVNGFHSRVYKESGLVRDILAKISDEYLGLLDKYTKEERASNSTYKESQTYKLINDSIVRYYTELAGTRQLSVFHNEIVRVIQEKIVETNEYQTNPNLTKVAEKGRQLSQTVSRLKQIHSEISTQYKNFSEYMRDASNDLTVEIPKLK